MPRGHVIDPDWLREHYPRMTDITELLDDYERDFGERPSKTSVYLKANRLGIKKYPVQGRAARKERDVYWSKEPEMSAWMHEHDRGQRCDVLSDDFRERFGFSLTRGQICRFRALYGKTWKQAKCRGGRHRMPVGTEREGKDGYIVVKVAEEAGVPMSKDNWKLKHVWIYEQTHGPVPKDHCVYFADGDKHNFDPDNLVLVPRKCLGVINGMGVKWRNADELKAIVKMAEIRIARNNILAEVERTCPVCGRTFTNASRRRAGNVDAVVCPECSAKGQAHMMGVIGRKYDYEEIRRMREQGMPVASIADSMGCRVETVRRALKRTARPRHAAAKGGAA